MLQGTVVNFTAYVADPAKEGTKWNGPTFEDVQSEELISHFDSWEEEVRLLVHVSEHLLVYLGVVINSGKK